MNETILEVSNLKTYFYSEGMTIPAVDGVSFSLQKGKVLGICGESGCGKSVTSQSILKLLPPKQAKIQEGSSIKLHGEEITVKTEKEMQDIRGKKIAMIFQDSMTSLNPVMRISRQMEEMPMKHLGMTRAEARKYSLEMLKKVGIPSPESRLQAYPHQLSGGMRQRILIAMQLSCNPEIIIADEPTTALDVTIQQQILDLMLEIKNTNSTSIMLITHDMGVVAQMTDDIMIMYAGLVMEQGETREIFANPLHPYTRGLISSIPRLDVDTQRLSSIKGNVPNWHEMPTGCRYCSRCPECMDICREKAPDLYAIGERRVRCFLYQNQGEEKEA